MKSYLLDLGGMEVLVHNNRGYALEDGDVKDYFKSIPVLYGEVEIASKNNQILKVIDETEAFKTYFEGFWGSTKVRDLLLECFNKNYTLEEASDIIGRAYPKPIEEQLQDVKEFIKKHTGEDWE